MDKGDIYFILGLGWTTIFGIYPVIAPKIPEWRAKRRYKGRHRKKK
ncbi:hypothetical protein ACFPPE_07250 [Agromyces tardus]